jgi:hypothetical protein
MTALNTLLADRSHRYRTADSVMTWWLRDPVEFPWMDWINEPESDQVTELVGKLYKPHRPPAVGGVDPNAFCAVTLSVNQSPGGGARLAGSPRRRGAAQAGPVVRRPPGHRPLEGRPAAGPALAAGQRDRPLGTEGNQERYLAAGQPHGCERDLLLTALRGTRPPGYLLPHLRGVRQQPGQRLPARRDCLPAAGLRGHRRRRGRWRRHHDHGPALSGVAASPARRRSPAKSARKASRPKATLPWTLDPPRWKASDGWRGGCRLEAAGPLGWCGA